MTGTLGAHLAVCVRARLAPIGAPSPSGRRGPLNWARAKLAPSWRGAQWPVQWRNWPPTGLLGRQPSGQPGGLAPTRQASGAVSLVCVMFLAAPTGNDGKTRRKESAPKEEEANINELAGCSTSSLCVCLLFWVWALFSYSPVYSLLSPLPSA